MRQIRALEFKKIVSTVESLCIQAAYELPSDVLAALRAAAAKESNPRAAKVLNQLIENALVASRQRIPLCQDTGLALVFVELGSSVCIVPPKDKPDATLIDAVNEGVAAGYEKGYLRKSVVAEPLELRDNTGTNTPAIVHLSIAPHDRLVITLLAKGGGCENKSQLRMFRPTASQQELAEWVVQVVKQAGADACPPLFVGLGLGGDMEAAALLSKKALLRLAESVHPDPFYARLEQQLLTRINALGIGPAGLGGDTTALAVHIQTASCHIASLPAAVTIECHSHRYKTATI